MGASVLVVEWVDQSAACLPPVRFQAPRRWLDLVEVALAALPECLWLEDRQVWLDLRDFRRALAEECYLQVEVAHRRQCRAVAAAAEAAREAVAVAPKNAVNRGP